MGRAMGEGMARGGALLFGRRTYEDFYALLAERSRTTRSPRCSTRAQKYVASTTLAEPLPWENSTLLEGDAVDAVARVKERRRRDLVVLGSGELVQSLIGARPRRRVRAADPPARPGHGAGGLFATAAPSTLRLVDSVTDDDGRDHRDVRPSAEER